MYLHVHVHVCHCALRSILVKMDDNIVRHYSNESTFLITLTPYGSSEDTTMHYDIILQDLE